MKNQKKDRIQFWVWMRNGFAFCTTWFLILELIYNHFFSIQAISTDRLIKILLGIIGGVFMFCLFFTRFLIKKWSFIKRLTFFMILISLYGCLSFYWLGFFQGIGTGIGWYFLIGVIVILYLSCVIICQYYSKKKGELYTKALRTYQKQRSRASERIR